MISYIPSNPNHSVIQIIYNNPRPLFNTAQPLLWCQDTDHPWKTNNWRCTKLVTSLTVLLQNALTIKGNSNTIVFWKKFPNSEISIVWMLILKALASLFVFRGMDSTCYISLTFLCNMPKPETFLKHLQETETAEHNGNIFFLITMWTMISFPKFPASLFWVVADGW